MNFPKWLLDAPTGHALMTVFIGVAVSLGAGGAIQYFVEGASLASFLITLLVGFGLTILVFILQIYRLDNTQQRNIPPTTAGVTTLDIVAVEDSTLSPAIGEVSEGFLNDAIIVWGELPPGSVINRSPRSAEQLSTAAAAMTEVQKDKWVQQYLGLGLRVKGVVRAVSTNGYGKNKSTSAMIDLPNNTTVFLETGEDQLMAYLEDLSVGAGIEAIGVIKDASIYEYVKLTIVALLPLYID